MRAAKAKRQPKAQHFELADPCLPIAGTPAPKPCPFCGVTDVQVVIQDPSSDGSRRAFVECTNCGAEAPGAWSDRERPLTSHELVVEAARYWNQRGGKAFAKIPSEAGV